MLLPGRARRVGRGRRRSAHGRDAASSAPPRRAQSRADDPPTRPTALTPPGRPLSREQRPATSRRTKSLRSSAGGSSARVVRAPEARLRAGTRGRTSARTTVRTICTRRPGGRTAGRMTGEAAHPRSMGVVRRRRYDGVGDRARVADQPGVQAAHAEHLVGVEHHRGWWAGWCTRRRPRRRVAGGCVRRPAVDVLLRPQETGYAARPRVY